MRRTRIAVLRTSAAAARRSRVRWRSRATGASASRRRRARGTGTWPAPLSRRHLRSIASVARSPLRHDQIDMLSGLEWTVFPLEAHPTQRIAHLAVGFGQPQRDAFRAQRLEDLAQQLGAGE